MATEVKPDKKTRKAKEQKLRDKANKIILEAHPETVEIAINKAHGVARQVTCPYCEGKFDIKVGDKANAELIKTLIEQVQGKPKQTQEIDLKATLELDNNQLLRLYTRLVEFQKEQAATTIETVEAEFKAIKEPKLPETSENQGLPETLAITVATE